MVRFGATPYPLRLAPYGKYPRAVERERELVNSVPLTPVLLV